jgi:hypothetical protein
MLFPIKYIMLFSNDLKQANMKTIFTQPAKNITLLVLSFFNSSAIIAQTFLIEILGNIRRLIHYNDHFPSLNLSPYSLEIFHFHQSKNIRLMKILNRNFYLLFLVFCTAISFAQSGSCMGTLQVEQNRNYSSTPPEGTYYTLLLSNTGASNATYTLSSSNINSSCSNNDGSSTSGNVNLAISFADTNSNSISEITLNPGETAVFLVNKKLPLGTTQSKSNCTQISAIATTCSNYALNTLLHTIVSDPNQE